jgi:hypothetical protein
LRQYGLTISFELDESGQSKSDWRKMGNIGEAPDGVHTWERKRSFCLDRPDAPVRDRRAYDAHVPLAGK